MVIVGSILLALGADAQDAVQVLAGLPVDTRVKAAHEWADERDRLERDVRLPSPGLLALLAARVPGAVQWSTPELDADGLPPVSPGRVEWERTVGRARDLQVVDVAHRLGCGGPVKCGSELAVRCPLHEDQDPSPRIASDGRRWYCDPCGEGGDGIQLWMRARRVSFAEAVRELAA